MAAKAFFAVALLVAAAIGLALPTPGASHEPQATRSSFQTIPIDRPGKEKGSPVSRRALGSYRPRP